MVIEFQEEEEEDNISLSDIGVALVALPVELFPTDVTAVAMYAAGGGLKLARFSYPVFDITFMDMFEGMCAS